MKIIPIFSILLILSCASTARYDGGLKIVDQNISELIKETKKNPSRKLSESDLRTLVQARDEIRRVDKNFEKVYQEKEKIEKKTLSAYTILFISIAVLLVVVFIKRLFFKS